MEEPGNAQGGDKEAAKKDSPRGREGAGERSEGASSPLPRLCPPGGTGRTGTTKTHTMVYSLGHPAELERSPWQREATTQ